MTAEHPFLNYNYIIFSLYYLLPNHSSNCNIQFLCIVMQRIFIIVNSREKEMVVKLNILCFKMMIHGLRHYQTVLFFFFLRIHKLRKWLKLRLQPPSLSSQSLYHQNRSVYTWWHLQKPDTFVSNQWLWHTSSLRDSFHVRPLWIAF